MVILLLVYCVTVFTPVRYTFCGHVVRFITGENGGEIAANDLVDDVNKMGQEKMRNWALVVIDRYNKHSLKLVGKAISYTQGDFRIADSEVPNEFKKHGFTGANIRVNHQSKKPECVDLVFFHMYGVVIGDKDYIFKDPYGAISCQKRIGAGICTWVVDK